MTVEFTLTWDVNERRKFLGLYGDVTRSLSRAGGDGIRAMRTAAGRSIRFRKRVKAARVRDGLPITFPTSRALADLVWRMDVAGDPVPVVQYPHRQARFGISVGINKGPRSRIPGAFVAKMRSGHEGVFRRRGKERLPIDELFSTRISDVFRDSGMIEAVQGRGLAVFSATFDRLMAAKK